MKPIVVVSCAIANKPHNGGNARMVLNWLEGLERLGVAVFFIEQIRSASCVDDSGAATPASNSVNRAYLERVMASHRFTGRSALICDAGETLDGAEVYGATAAEVTDIARDAELLINISGHLAVPALKNRFRRSAYVDLDPGYTQVWHLDGSGAARLEGHDVYFTVGQRVGTSAFPIATNGIAWQAIRQPIVLDRCATASADETGRFTTIASWRGAYAPIEHAGQVYRVKAHEFRKLVDLPRVSSRGFEIALDIHPGDARDLDALRAAGWGIVDPRRVSSTPEDYCAYIESSAAECSAAQGMYVQTKSGWFSDRTARYLASGKPALIQDTGFDTPGRDGDGLVVFDSMEEAARGAERICRDYRGHCEAARALAERYFDSDTELGRVLQMAGVS
jgi:hypothetical protein